MESLHHPAKEDFPDANLIQDRFHLIKYLNDGIDQVRQREARRHVELQHRRLAPLGK